MPHNPVSDNEQEQKSLYVYAASPLRREIFEVSNQVNHLVVKGLLYLSVPQSFFQLLKRHKLRVQTLCQS